MPTKPELETCIAELESLITLLEADRNKQKERADEWQALAEHRQETILEYQKYLRKELKKTRKRHYGKKKRNIPKIEQLFEWYKEHRKLGNNIEDSLHYVAWMAFHANLFKGEKTKHKPEGDIEPISDQRVHERLKEQYGNDYDKLVNAK